jgi:hypothetical protein
MKLATSILLISIVTIFAIDAAPSLGFTEFRTGTGKGEITGKNKGTFSFIVPGVGSSTECTTVKVVGDYTSTKSTKLVENPAYENCSAFASVAAEVSGLPTPIASEFMIGGKLTMLSTVLIKIPAVKCEIEFPSKENKSLKSVTYTNVGSGSTKEIEEKIDVLNATAIGKNGCPLSTSKAELLGTLMIRAERPKNEQVSIEVV